MGDCNYKSLLDNRNFYGSAGSTRIDKYATPMIPKA